jgi:hypothetical protein
MIDRISRSVIVWRLSNTLDGSFCLEMQEEALRSGKPEVWNTNQGVQFTAASGVGGGSPSGEMVGGILSGGSIPLCAAVPDLEEHPHRPASAIIIIGDRRAEVITEHDEPGSSVILKERVAKNPCCLV